MECLATYVKDDPYWPILSTVYQCFADDNQILYNYFFIFLLYWMYRSPIDFFIYLESSHEKHLCLLIKLPMSDMSGIGFPHPWSILLALTLDYLTKDDSGQGHGVLEEKILFLALISGNQKQTVKFWKSWTGWCHVPAGQVSIGIIEIFQ